jgi:hypothetical protein
VTLLQIDVQGTDADGNTATGTVEVEVADPATPAAPPVTPAPVTGAATFPAGAMEESELAAAEAPEPAASPQPVETPEGGAMPIARPADLAPGGEEGAAARLYGDKPVQITGLTNSQPTGHIGAQPAAPAPKVTQAVRSMTLLRNTGGYR